MTMDGKAYRVVLCEDEPLLLETLAQKIRKTGLLFFVAGMAQNGQEALALLRDQPADLLITDIRMPIMDGIALLRAVMAHGLATSCVLLSGYDEFDYARTALRLGAFDYLLKPVSQNELASVLSRLSIHLDARRADELYQFSSTVGASTDEVLDAVRLYIQAHAFEEISLSALSDSMNYSAAHISRLFAKKYGEPPQRYQTTLRMNEAKRLLMHFPDQTVRQIAERVGYPDQGYFSRIFRQTTGKTPQQFRGEGSESPS